MAEDGDAKTVIIDNGSGMVKAGIAGQDAPTSVFPAVVGVPKGQSVMQVQQKDCYIGDEANQKRGILTLSYPIEAGIVNSWDNMEKVWQHTLYTELRVEPGDIHGLLLTEAPLNPKANREKMTQIMFETFNIQRLYVAIQAVMSLYSAGRTTGLVVDAGDGVSHTVPVYEGFSVPHAVKKMDIAGRVLTMFMQKLLQESINETFTSSAELEIVKAIKEKVSLVAMDYDTELADAKKSSNLDYQYELPDKRVITIKGETRLNCPELLFKPDLNGKTVLAMHMLAWNSVQESDIDIRKDLLKNIILSGGSTMYQNLPERMKKEIEGQAPAGADVKVIAGADRKYAVWKGASTLASLSTFADKWVTKEDYEEHGAEVIHRKCN